MTTKKTYSIKSIEKDIATVTVIGSVTGDGVTEMQGTSISFHIETKSTGEIIVDMKKGLVNKNTNDVDMTATMDVMGQSMPISSKGSFSVVYQY
jgi:phage-related protein